MTALFNVVVPVALIVLVGFAAGRRMQFDIATLSRLTLYVFAPALAFNSMYRASIGAEAATRIFVAFALSTFALFWIARAVGRAAGQSDAEKRSLVATTIFPNVGNFGLSLTLFALGDAGLEFGLVTFASGAFMTFGLGPALVSGQGFVRGIRTTVRLPLIWALLAGVGLRAAGIDLPTGIEGSVSLVAAAAIPLLLITLGLQISQSKLAVEPSDWIACTLRLAVGPLIAYMAGRVVGLDPLALKVLVLQCCTPTAVNAMLVSTEFGGDGRRAARIVVLTSLLSLLTIPIVMYFMGIGG